MKSILQRGKLLHKNFTNHFGHTLKICWLLGCLEPKLEDRKTLGFEPLERARVLGHPDLRCLVSKTGEDRLLLFGVRVVAFVAAAQKLMQLVGSSLP